MAMFNLVISDNTWHIMLPCYRMRWLKSLTKYQADISAHNRFIFFIEQPTLRWLKASPAADKVTRCSDDRITHDNIAVGERRRSLDTGVGGEAIQDCPVNERQGLGLQINSREYELRLTPRRPYEKRKICSSACRRPSQRPLLCTDRDTDSDSKGDKENCNRRAPTHRA
jgi:hypothetical protein